MFHWTGEKPVVDVLEFGSPAATLSRNPQLSPFRNRRDVDLCKRGEIRAGRFLDAATEVFAEKGYQHAKLSEIVARAGGSLATLYRIFGDKEGLAHAIIERRIENHVNLMRDLGLTGMPPEQALRKVAIRVSQSMTRTESLVFYRILIGDGQSFPRVRDWYFSQAVPMMRSHIADYFRQQVQLGRLRLASAELAAGQFHMMLFGDLILSLSSGYTEPPDPELVLSNALAAVDIFLQGALMPHEARTAAAP